MAGVDKLLEPMRSAIAVLNRIGKNAVVSPAVATREGRHRQDLHELDPEIDEMVEPLDRGLERARRCERADVQLVDEPSEQLSTAPVIGLPAELARGRRAAKAHERRRAAMPNEDRAVAARRPDRSRTGAMLRFDVGGPPASLARRHRVAPAIDLDVDLCDTRAPTPAGSSTSRDADRGHEQRDRAVLQKLCDGDVARLVLTPDSASTHSPPGGTASGSSTTVSRQPPARSRWAENLVAKTATSGERLNATR